MNGIDRLPPLPALAAPGGAAGAELEARTMVGEVGARVAGWASANFGGDAARAWSDLSGAASFNPDRAQLAQGDAYGLRQLASEAADRLGATPAQEGALLRALEDLTRAAALNINALAGSSDQLVSLSDALDVASGGSGVDGVLDRLDTATRRLESANL